MNRPVNYLETTYFILRDLYRKILALWYNSYVSFSVVRGTRTLSSAHHLLYQEVFVELCDGPCLVTIIRVLLLVRNDSLVFPRKLRVILVTFSKTSLN